MTALLLAARRAVFDDDHEAFRESATRFCAETPLSEVFRAGAEHGVVAMQVAEEHGGAGVEDPRFAAVVVEAAMATGATATALALLAHNLVAVPVMLDEEDRQAALAEGRLVLGIALDTAVRTDDDVLSGELEAVVNGMAADAFLVGAADGGLWLVDADHAEREPLGELIGVAGADVATATLDGAPATRLGDATAAAAALDLGLALAAVAGARRVLQVTAEYVADRRAFGRPIADFENTRRLVGRGVAELTGAEALADRTLRAHVDGRAQPADAVAAKLIATEAFGRIADTGVQLHGGYGYMAEYDVAGAYTDARVLRLLGTPEAAATERLAGSLGVGTG